VDASAGTHSGGGAADISVRGWTEPQALRVVEALRERNGVAWLRSQKFGWSGTPHIHVIFRDEPGLSPQAKAQISSYDRGKNGLAGGRPDPHRRPVQRPIEEWVMPQSPYTVEKASTQQTLALNTWEKMDLGRVDHVFPPIGPNDWEAYVNFDLTTLKGAKRNDLRYVLGRWARRDASSDDLIVMGGGKYDVTGADTKAIPPDLPRTTLRYTWSHGFVGEKDVPVSFWMFIGSMASGSIESPLRIFKVDSEAAYPWGTRPR
jgi:hypothetical protein